jgi:hypothetical protein
MKIINPKNIITPFQNISVSRKLAELSKKVTFVNRGSRFVSPLLRYGPKEISAIDHG